MDIVVDLLQWFINFLLKKSSDSGIKNICNRELARELHKSIFGKFNDDKEHSPFIDNIWGADLADMQLISKINKEFRFLLCVIGIDSKYAWVIPLEDRKRSYDFQCFSKHLR